MQIYFFFEKNFKKSVQKMIKKSNFNSDGSGTSN
jgi:hypothetical protein